MCEGSRNVLFNTSLMAFIHNTPITAITDPFLNKSLMHLIDYRLPYSCCKSTGTSDGRLINKIYIIELCNKACIIIVSPARKRTCIVWVSLGSEGHFTIADGTAMRWRNKWRRQMGTMEYVSTISHTVPRIEKKPTSNLF